MLCRHDCASQPLKLECPFFDFESEESTKLHSHVMKSDHFALFLSRRMQTSSLER